MLADDRPLTRLCRRRCGAAGREHAVAPDRRQRSRPPVAPSMARRQELVAELR
jgi:hypothetical protein